MQRAIARTPLRPRAPLNWDDARLLLALLRAPSLAQAARSLGIDKSTLSRRIEGLETTLAARLFLRTREGLRPSAVGERLRLHAERIEGEMRALESAAIAGGEEVTGLVRIATTEGMASRLVSGGLLDLMHIHPGLRLEIVGGNRPVDLARGEADLALRVTKTTDPQLKVRVLGKFPISLFASPKYLRTRGSPTSLTALAGHEVLLPSGELSMLPEAKLLAAAQPRVAFSSSSLPALVEAAVRGHGLVPLTRAWGEAVEGLDHVLELPVPPRPTWLVMHPDVAKRAAVRVVADHLAQAFRAFR